MLPDEIKQHLRNYLKKGYDGWSKRFEKAWQQWQAPDRPRWLREPAKPEAVSDKQFDQLCRFIEEGGPEPEVRPQQMGNIVWVERNQFGDWLAPPAIQLIQLIRLCYALHILRVQKRESENYLWWNDRSMLEAYRSRCQSPFGLRELDACVATLPGAETGLVAEAYLNNNTKWSTFCDWEPEAVWPAFAERPQLIREVLAPRAANYGNR